MMHLRWLWLLEFSPLSSAQWREVMWSEWSAMVDSAGTYDPPWWSFPSSEVWQTGYNSCFGLFLYLYAALLADVLAVVIIRASQRQQKNYYSIAICEWQLCVFVCICWYQYQNSNRATYDTRETSTSVTRCRGVSSFLFFVEHSYS